MLYVYNAPESPADQRYVYHWEILRTALERTTAAYGPFVLTPAVAMSERRQADELQRATGALTVMYLDTNPTFERSLEPVRIPVDKNLAGFRVFLIRAEDRARFAAVHTLEDLRALKVGLGLGWLDVEILRHSGFEVVTGSSYDGLFAMLVNRRFDGFLRGAVEILGEHEQRHAAMPDLAIEDSLLLYYPLPMYFWFSRTAQGRRLAARVRDGMQAMIDDGSYDRIFLAHHGHKIEQLHLASRRILEIPNPFVGPETPLEDTRLWFDPKAGR